MYYIICFMAPSANPRLLFLYCCLDYMRRAHDEHRDVTAEASDTDQFRLRLVTDSVACLIESSALLFFMCVSYMIHVYIDIYTRLYMTII